MLDPDIKTQLSSYMERLVEPIELVASLNDTPAGEELREFLQDVAQTHTKINLRLNGNSKRQPSFSVGRVDAPPRIFFAGIPTGHEFTSLVLAILQTSGYPPKAPTEVLAQIQAMQPTSPLDFEVFVSLTCHNCPDVVQAINLMATLNANVTCTMIDGALFQTEVEDRQVLAVPMVFLNGQHFGQGRMSIEEILAKVDINAGAHAIQALSQKAPYDVLVVGGGPAGAAGAIYAARKGISTGVVTERFGGQVLDTVSIENFISVKHTEGAKLAVALEEHVREYGVDIIKAQRAQRIIPAPQVGGLHQLELANGAVLIAKTLILSTGASWREMNVPGEAQYKGRGVCFCPHCDGPLFRGKPVAVIGGGNSGVEAAIDLAGIVSHVTLIEFDTKLRADAVLQEKLKSLPNVNIILNALTTEVLGDGQQVTGIVYQERNTQEKHNIMLAGIFVQIGLLPNTNWLKGVINLSPRGEIEVNAKGETNVAGIVAAGDCTNSPYKQIIIAAGDGAKAALSAFDYLIRH